MTIGLCMIVRDEADDLPGCLDSVKHIVDEIVVMDTGSVDGTQETAKRLGAKVYGTQWVDDFSAVRNLSLEKVTTDWVLMLDADERLAAKDCQRILSLTRSDGIDAYYFIQRHYLPGAGYDKWMATSGEYPEMELNYTGYTQNYVLRLFRRLKGVEWEGRIHETVVCSEPETRWITAKTDVVVHHYGKVGDTVRLDKKKRLYVKLARQKAEELSDDAKAWFELGIQLHELGEWEECIAPFERAFKLDESNINALYYIGNSRFKVGKLKEAKEDLFRVLGSDPDHTDALVSLAGVERAEGDNEEAVKLFDLAIDTNKKSFAAWFNKAALLLSLGRYKEAGPCFEMAIKLMPDNIPAAFGKWQNDIFLGRFRIAADEMTVWLEKMPEIRSSVSQAAENLLQHRRFDLIKNAFPVIIAEALDDAKVYAVLGAAALDSGDVGDAETKLEKAIGMDESLNDARVNLAQLKEVYRHNIIKAIDLYEDALRRDPANDFAARRLEDLKNR
ncbi:hypothetical protein MNBD_NITROSPINAE04-914 [hydrothermal vent metagenome]|uniref:Glycosyltransferase 2-like domain-containing protein n=1 Tax=hydrothermal vent metagenome TaxID=652676 RepID=A0A3B1CHX1_9ZZZZ